MALNRRITFASEIVLYDNQPAAPVAQFDEEWRESFSSGSLSNHPPDPVIERRPLGLTGDDGQEATPFEPGCSQDCGGDVKALPE